MAYRQPYDPDALPRFAEPDRPGATSSSTQPPPPRQEKPTPPLPPQTRPSASSYGHPSPPPTGGQRPPAHNRPPASSRPPPTPGPEGSASDPTLLPLFRAVDKDGTGQLSEKELSAALVNGDWTAFDTQTIRMMIRMFDSDRSGTIGFDEFCGLWSFLASWRTLFDRFDVDRSGNISLDEFNDALVAFRYRLSPPFVELLFRTYDKRQEGVMSFDLFVQACISLKRMTDVFKKYDDDRDGYITLSFEDFLSEILKQLK
ncbi:Programmed cell death protein-like protein [Hapsidospora chrysogenum ATCC 11550]|uniref:Programmed cell death protein-like protein n=1 Tax=Hapsidospora chrysogenum (strain ATCC 11550 / CBS 779.69 / DSM 880 / IAM 14645 / JCM 23072 / IMI 49137) TaxID=857340 RepID=A0A086STV8_HAPC1|nr:Programmed cell death protein-like protein [Hapsidospora chrysogenum ATCC 11550]